MSAIYYNASLERALSGPAFVVDPLTCGSVAHIVKTMHVRSTAQLSDRSFSDESLYRVTVAAICHSINWDYLGIAARSALLSLDYNPERLKEIDSRDVARWLGDYHKPERVRAKERAAILRDVASIIVAQYDSDAGQIFHRSGSKIYSPGGLLDQLDNFPVFAEDPLRKKSNVLLHEAIREEFFFFDDVSAIQPAIDYHIMRLYLRTGRVVPRHRETLAALQHDITPRSRLTTLLRRSVSEALSLTAFYSDTSVPAMNGIEWQIGRDICVRTDPQCDTGVLTATIGDGTPAVGCPYRSVCRAYHDPQLRKLREPNSVSRFY